MINPPFKMLADDFFTLEDSKWPGRKGSRVAPLSKADPHYTLVERRFDKGWKHPDKPKPPVHAIFKVLLTQESLGSYRLYKGRIANAPTVKNHKRLGNEKLLFHGTDRSCLLAEDVSRVRLCDLSDCHLCRIVRNSFDIAKCGAKHKFRRFGTGIYSTTCSSKADDYVVNGSKNSNLRVMLASRVIVGKPSKRRHNATGLTAPPFGYHSVVGKPGCDLNYQETVVYDNDAIRPAFLIVYGTVPDKESVSMKSVITKLFKTPIAS